MYWKKNAVFLEYSYFSFNFFSFAIYTAYYELLIYENGDIHYLLPGVLGVFEKGRSFFSFYVRLGMYLPFYSFYPIRI